MKVPRGVVVDDEGFIYVADSRNNRIVKFDKKYEQVDSTPQAVKEYGEHSYLFGMCIMDREMYIADIANHCIQVRNLDLKQQNSFDEGLQGKLCDPIGIAFDVKNKIFYVAHETHGVEKFDVEFRPIRTIKKIKKGEQDIKLDRLRGTLATWGVSLGRETLE